jgi:hypothetical protein
MWGRWWRRRNSEQRKACAAERKASQRVTVCGSCWIVPDFAGFPVALRSREKSLNVADSSTFRLVLPGRIELTTSPLPRGCSTTELRQQKPPGAARPAAPRRAGTCHKGCRGARTAVAAPSNVGIRVKSDLMDRFHETNWSPGHFLSRPMKSLPARARFPAPAKKFPALTRERIR